MTIIVSGVDHVTRLVTEEGAGRVISLLDPASMIDTPAGLDPVHHLKVLVHDIPEPQTGLIHPEPEHADAVIDFIRDWDQSAPMISHCWMGVSRSSAAAYIALCMAHPGREAQAAWYLRGRALVVVANKWDGQDRDQRRQVRSDFDRRLPFLDFAERMTISALHGTAVGDVLPATERAYEAATRDMSTTELTRELEDAQTAHAPPLVRGRRIKLRYAHQGGRNPPVIVIHGNQTDKLPDAYRRYLINRFRKKFRLQGTPVRLSFKSSDNPFKGRRNKLTPRQERRRKRLMKRVKK